MNALIRGLMWPITSLLFIGGSHLVAEILRPELAADLTPAAVMPLYLAAGAWTGYATYRAGGRFLLGVAAGAVLGLLPVALQLVGFGIILGRDTNTVTTNAIFGFVTILWGAMLGAGFAACLATSLNPTREAHRETADSLATVRT